MRPDWKDSDPWWTIVGLSSIVFGLGLLGWIVVQAFRSIGLGPAW